MDDLIYTVLGLAFCLGAGYAFWYSLQKFLKLGKDE